MASRNVAQFLVQHSGKLEPVLFSTYVCGGSGSMKGGKKGELGGGEGEGGVRGAAVSRICPKRIQVQHV
jgi:hypothetical protein